MATSQLWTAAAFVYVGKALEVSRNISILAQEPLYFIIFFKRGSEWPLLWNNSSWTASVSQVLVRCPAWCDFVSSKWRMKAEVSLFHSSFIGNWFSVFLCCGEMSCWIPTRPCKLERKTVKRGRWTWIRGLYNDRDQRNLSEVWKAKDFLFCFSLVQRHHIGDRSLSLCNMFLDEMAKQARNLITDICTEQCTLSDQVSITLNTTILMLNLSLNTKTWSLILTLTQPLNI